MIFEIKNYFCTNIPEKSDIQSAVARAKLGYCVLLSWYGPAHGYYGDDEHRVMIKPEDDVETVMNKLPKIYGV